MCLYMYMYTETSLRYIHQNNKGCFYVVGVLDDLDFLLYTFLLCLLNFCYHYSCCPGVRSALWAYNLCYHTGSHA